MKKLARVGALSYSLVSDVRSVGICTRRCKETAMLWTIFVIVFVLWLLGLVSSSTLGGVIHLLRIIAVEAQCVHYEHCSGTHLCR